MIDLKGEISKLREKLAVKRKWICCVVSATIRALWKPGRPEKPTLFAENASVSASGRAGRCAAAPFFRRADNAALQLRGQLWGKPALDIDAHRPIGDHRQRALAAMTYAAEPGVGHSGWRRSPMAGSRFSPPRAGRMPRRCVRPGAPPAACGPTRSGWRDRAARTDLQAGKSPGRSRSAGWYSRPEAKRCDGGAWDKVTAVAPPFVQQGRGGRTRYQKWVLTLRYRCGPIHCRSRRRRRTSCRWRPGGLGVARAPVALIEDVIHAAGQTDVFGDVPGRAQAEDAVGANLVLLAAGDRLTLVVVLLRLLLAVPVKVDCSETSSRTCQLRVEFSVYSGIIDRRSPVFCSYSAAYR